MLLAELQEAMRPRNSERGQDVVNNLFTPPSVGVLSLSVGRQMFMREWPWWALAVIAKASWAKVSKQAMYFWACFSSDLVHAVGLRKPC